MLTKKKITGHYENFKIKENLFSLIADKSTVKCPFRNSETINKNRYLQQKEDR